MFEDYECWVKRETTANTEARVKDNDRLQVLNQQVANLQDTSNAAHDLTTERTDTEAEIAEQKKAIDEAQKRRDTEIASFQAAETEMQQAVDALESAIKVLKDATKPATSTAFLAATTDQGYTARVVEAGKLKRAVDLGSQVLSSADAEFLRRVLTADVPVKRDWKKLNKKTDYKDEYEARSGGIMKTLNKLQDQFATSLQEARTSNDKAEADHQDLMTVKRKSLENAETALKNLDKENAERAALIEKKNAEIKELTDAISAVDDMLPTMASDLSTRAAEWEARRSARVDEMAAISKAIGILRSDENRDLLARTVFLQVSEVSSRSAMAAKTLTDAAAGDSRMLQLAATSKHAADLQVVLDAIEIMKQTLAQEETSEFERVKECRENRRAMTLAAVEAARDADESSDDITAEEAKKDEDKSAQQEVEQQSAAVQKSLQEAEKLRDSEKLAYEEAQADRVQTLAVIQQAIQALESFYAQSGSGSALLATSERVAEAPKLWNADPYAKTSASTGVIDMLQAIYNDVQKEKGVAETQEKESEAKYTQLKADLDAESGSLSDRHNTLSEALVASDDNINTFTGDRRADKDDVDAEIANLQ